MARALSTALDIMTRFDGKTSGPEIAHAYFEAVVPFGLKALFARAYREVDLVLPGQSADSGAHIFARISPPQWEEAYARARLDRNSPVIAGTKAKATPFAWSDIPDRLIGDWQGWNVLDDFNIADGLAIPCHGAHGYRAVVSMGFETLDMRPEDRRAIELTAIVAHERLSVHVPIKPAFSGNLTQRERDCLAYVAHGKSDWEISVIMGLSQSTAHAHVENAKRKLGARTRAQAVARLILMGLV